MHFCPESPLNEPGLRKYRSPQRGHGFSSRITKSKSMIEGKMFLFFFSVATNRSHMTGKPVHANSKNEQNTKDVRILCFPFKNRVKRGTTTRGNK